MLIVTGLCRFGTEQTSCSLLLPQRCRSVKVGRIGYGRLIGTSVIARSSSSASGKRGSTRVSSSISGRLILLLLLGSCRGKSDSRTPVEGRCGCDREGGAGIVLFVWRLLLLLFLFVSTYRLPLPPFGCCCTIPYCYVVATSSLFTIVMMITPPCIP
jgi:hypothetical protein